MRLLLSVLLMSCGDKDEPTDTIAEETDADSDADSDADARYHPEGYSTSEQHGGDAKQHTETCTDCHGADLTGGDDGALSCNTCHTPEEPEAWRTDCTFCHGGGDNATGAPPESIDDSKTDDAFGAHSRHVEENTHAPFDCESCHVTPEDILATGHIFDATPGVAEVDFTAGLSAAGAWNAKKNACTNLYCHSTGQADDGEVSVADGPLACDSCHAGMDSSREERSTMSGEHSHHIGHNIGCHECHSDTTSDDASISGTALHVNGVPDIVLDHDPQIQWDSTQETCTGQCHGENHNNRTWVH